MRPLAVAATAAMAVLFQLIVFDALSRMRAGQVPIEVTANCDSTQIRVTECTEGWQVFACGEIPTEKQNCGPAR